MLKKFIRQMPKVELHVHLEGAIQPATLLELARRNGVRLPADDVAGLQRWYQFTDFKHFLDIYLTISSCICTPEDIELIARAFLRGQSEQNIRYSEITFTPYTHFSLNRRIPFDEQLDALTRARTWAAQTLDVHCGWVFDVARNVRPIEHANTVAEWAVQGLPNGVIGFGLGGLEAGNPPEWFAEAFAYARAKGLAALPHAGEIVGPASIWGALNVLGAQRLGHGVRCLEDPLLIEHLREQQIPLEVCPTSNVCLGVAASFAEHPLPRLLAEGLYVTLNSDDPPMFNTTLTNEYAQAAEAFGLGVNELTALSLNALRASCLPDTEKLRMETAFQTTFNSLQNELLA